MTYFGTECLISHLMASELTKFIFYAWFIINSAMLASNISEFNEIAQQLPTRIFFCSNLLDQTWISSGICLPGTELRQSPFRMEFSMGSRSWQYRRSLWHHRWFLRHHRRSLRLSRDRRSLRDLLNIVKRQSGKVILPTDIDISHMSAHLHWWKVLQKIHKNSTKKIRLQNLYEKIKISHYLCLQVHGNWKTYTS